MLKMPIVTVTTENGKTNIPPAKWTLRNAIYILVESSNLARQACQLYDDSDEIKALRVLVDGGYLPMEVFSVGTDALREATGVILQVIAEGKEGGCQKA